MVDKFSPTSSESVGARNDWLARSLLGKSQCLLLSVLAAVGLRSCHAGLRIRRSAGTETDSVRGTSLDRRKGTLGMDDLSTASVESDELNSAVAAPETDSTTQPFVGRWNQLVSNTNWEKGRIIFQWREALIAAGAPAAEYSDESWSRRVGGITAQHVGRLRRVSERFGTTYGDYRGLYWSHFQAALDWKDAEMWLEGAVQNRWSVAQMRRTRWETLGAVEGATEPSDDAVFATELDEDFEPAQHAPPSDEAIAPDNSDVQSGPLPEGPDFGDEEPREHRDTARAGSESGPSIYTDEQASETIEFVQPFANLAELPSDLAEAFECFKLAVLRHKSEQWLEISKDDVLASLAALKQLVLAPA